MTPHTSGPLSSLSLAWDPTSLTVKSSWTTEGLFAAGLVLLILAWGLDSRPTQIPSLRG